VRLDRVAHARTASGHLQEARNSHE
jgi:hypothetical protein